MTQFNAIAKLLGAVVTAVAALALLAPVASATTPALGYEEFAGCPSPSEDPNVAGCLYSEITGGHFQMGTKDVPLEKTITISGGFEEGLLNFTANSKGGLSPVKQKVPGGVVGLTGLTWLLELFGSEALTLYATTEAAGQPTLGFTTITLPIRVHLTNPGGLIGNTCYVGSFTEPITLHLTTETTNPPPPNEPITGKTPEFSESVEPPGILEFHNGTYVDNAFAAPGANGCKLYLFGFIPISINGLVDEQSGLPSPAGTNETVQNFNLDLVESSLVYP